MCFVVVVFVLFCFVLFFVGVCLKNEVHKCIILPFGSSPISHNLPPKFIGQKHENIETFASAYP